jgi:uncharacterized small protein (DUF1192 family)
MKVKKFLGQITCQVAALHLDSTRFYANIFQRVDTTDQKLALQAKEWAELVRLVKELNASIAGLREEIAELKNEVTSDE